MSPARANVSVAIRRPDDDSILVLRDGTLPGFDVAFASPWQVVAPVNEAMSERLGLTVTTLRAAWLSDLRDERLYEAAWRAGKTPGGCRWLALEDLMAAEPMATKAGRMALVDGALHPAEGNLQPWYVPGWLHGMEDWIDSRLSEAGLRRHGAIRQVRSWGRSALLQADTDRGLVWAKEVPSSFAHEIAVTGLLADLDPGVVPPIIAMDEAAGRLLMAHVDGSALTDVSVLDAWIATLARVAETQRVLSVERDRLAVAGVASASLATLAEEVHALVADDGLLRIGLEGGVSEGAARRLEAQADALAQACRDLASSDVPDSLDHGDLAPSQVIVGEMGPVIFDWSDASITHPFLSLAAFLGDPAPGVGRMRERMIDAYLGPWVDRVDRVSGLDACRLATTVMPLHLARLFRDRVLPGLEQRWEMDRVVPALLERLAARLANGSVDR